MRANLKAAIDVRFGSQLAFARAVGLHSVRVNRLCRGWVEPTPVERERISEALRADPCWLFAALFIPALGVARDSEKASDSSSAVVKI